MGDPQERRHFALNRPRIGPAELLFQRGALSLLGGGHAPAAAALAFGEAVYVVAPLADQEMKESRPVLAMLEALEAVEDEWFLFAGAGTGLFVKEQTMPT